MLWWKGDKDDPQEPHQEQPNQEKPLKYTGPWSEQFYKVVIYAHVTPPGGGQSFPTRYAFIVADFNMSAFAEALNGNNVVYTVIPLETVGAEGEEEDD